MIHSRCQELRGMRTTRERERGSDIMEAMTPKTARRCHLTRSMARSLQLCKEDRRAREREREGGRERERQEGQNRTTGGHKSARGVKCHKRGGTQGESWRERENTETTHTPGMFLFFQVFQSWWCWRSVRNLKKTFFQNSTLARF